MGKKPQATTDDVNMRQRERRLLEERHRRLLQCARLRGSRSTERVACDGESKHGSASAGHERCAPNPEAAATAAATAAADVEAVCVLVCESEPFLSSPSPSSLSCARASEAARDRPVLLNRTHTRTHARSRRPPATAAAALVARVLAVFSLVLHTRSRCT